LKEVAACAGGRERAPHKRIDLAFAQVDGDGHTLVIDLHAVTGRQRKTQDQYEKKYANFVHENSLASMEIAGCRAYNINPGKPFIATHLPFLHNHYTLDFILSNRQNPQETLYARNPF
jgi:hypothetical protein